ncbi:LPA [Branchiostoma lanceolatum]|uniref:LPA protein n=1 Tax=Branchiostoma lanceolatum TaxID=7740 RepID=A0A8J9Z3J9_BRALA|nr:LPA [Branchiostoma lanceolatum]
MAKLWLNVLLIAPLFFALRARKIKEEISRMPDNVDADEASNKTAKSVFKVQELTSSEQRRDIPFWNDSRLCNYHECFKTLKTWPEVPYYLLKDGNFVIDWPTRYIRMLFIYHKNAFDKVFQGDRGAVENHAMEAVAILDKAYRTINFRVLLSGVEILENYWPGEEESPHYYDYLKPKVREYIWNDLRPVQKFDTATFITGPPYFHGTSATGAGMGDLCQMKSVDNFPFIISGSTTITTGRPADYIDVLTHEMGHQFFVGHPFDPLDDGDSPCPTRKLFGSACTMGGNEYPKSFGQAFFDSIRKHNFTCLEKKPPQEEVYKCGNGFVDHGEECDCGSDQSCLMSDPCCDGQTCKLKDGAQCTEGQICCKNCKVDLESCPVSATNTDKRVWAPFFHASTFYTEINTPASGVIEPFPFGQLAPGDVKIPGKMTPPNSVFSWLLHAPVGQTVKIHLMMPQMKSEYFEVCVGCPYDWLEVRDGGKVTSPLLGRYCTPLQNHVITSSKNKMLLRLRSDSSFDSHFVVKYEFHSQVLENDEDSESQEGDVEDEICQKGNGASYRGKWFTTVSGRRCQRWDSQTPHSHSRTPSNYPSAGLEKNYCRNPDGEDAVWCYTTDPDERWDWCPVPKCASELEKVGEEVQDMDAGECYTDRGESYRGKVALTWSGQTCQEWSSQNPYSHSYTAEKYPDADLTNNYCRNPNSDDDIRPWCYTTSAKERWNYCAIPKCLSIDASVPDVKAASCAEAKSLHLVNQDGEYTIYPFSTCKDVSIRVYCHNMASGKPKEFLSLPSGPESNYAMIFAERLTDVYGGRCDGPLQDPYSTRAGTTTFSKVRIKFENSRIKVIRDDYTFARTIGYNNVSYAEAGDCYSWKQGCAKGTFQVNLTGTELQLAPDVHWVMEERHPEYIAINDMFISEDRKIASARCGGWCGHCWPEDKNLFLSHPQCERQTGNEETCQEGKGGSYRGKKRTTKSGRQCQRWDSQSPHEHSRTPETYPTAGLERNYCRNPDDSDAVWCYTADPEKRWEYCDVTKCEAASKCPHQDPPINGALSCDAWLYGQFCSVQCDERYDFSTEPASLYVCGSAGKWRTDPPGGETKWPDCTVRRNPEHTNGAEFQYYEGDCEDEESRQNVQQNFIDHFGNTVFGKFGGCTGNANCTADNIRVACGQKNSDVVVDFVP